MTSQHATLKAFTDAAADAVARAIAGVQREAQREKELREAEHRACMAELEVRLSSAASLERQLADRLTTLKDGEPGQDGRDGVDGLPGKDGRDGLDGKNGADGAPGERGLPGEDGASGLPGRDGRDGIDGFPGSDGRDGLDGKDGVDGAPGPPGQDGRDGRDGIDGRDGAPGERGPEGQVGKLPIVRAWTDTVSYEGDVVTFEGRTYQALRDTGKEPGGEDWICLSDRGADGRDGADGQSFAVRGTWLPINEYHALDVVALNGASFVAKIDNPGPCPGEGWQLIASQGKRGERGERGVAGARGERGPAGPAVSSIEIDREGMMTLINADGSIVACDLYPVLSRIG